MQVTDWCAIAATLAFVVLAAVAVRTLLPARRVMQQAGQAVDRLERQLAETAEQTKRLLHKTDVIAADVQSKLQALTAVTNSVQEVGASISEVGGTVRKASKTLARSVLEVEQAVHTHRARVQEAMEWAVTGVELWQRWHAGRKEHSERAQRNRE